MSYWRFAAMILTSTVVMFGLMYLNTFAFEHVFWSQTRAWMALVMGATMAVIMLAFMLSMYTRTKLNIAIFAGAIMVFGASLWLVRSQVTVDDSSYMSAMIPHHSIAIMTSDRAQISDPRVRKLADEIISAQQREIAEMKYLLGDIDERGESDAPNDAVAPALMSPSEALADAHIATLDPAPLSPEDIEAGLGSGARCAFSYTSESEPIFVLDPDGGDDLALLEVNGALIALSRAAADGPAVFEAGDVRVTLTGEQQAQGLDADQQEATMVFEIGSDLRVGYGGYYRCGA